MQCVLLLPSAAWIDLGAMRGSIHVKAELILDSGMADRRFASVIDSTRLFASRAVSPKTQPLRVEQAL
jgi:hypothetical protein